MRDIRGLTIPDLANKLHESLKGEEENLSTNERFSLNQQNRRTLRHILARLTNYVEIQSGQPSHYLNYVGEGKARYEIEHIWSIHYDQHKDEFSNQTDFMEYRNRIGGLLLLPKSFNASYGDLSFEDKLSHYNTQNLLARSLHKQCYKHNPGFLNFLRESKLPFKPYETFDKAAIEERSILYRELARHVWNPDALLTDKI